MSKPVFRAWDKAKKEWIAKDFHIVGEVMSSGLLFDNRNIAELDDIEISQFTGFFDSNKKPIYEDDVIEYLDSTTVYSMSRVQTPYRRVVVKEGYWSPMIEIFELFEGTHAKLTDSTKFRIVGNRFESPVMFDDLI